MSGNMTPLERFETAARVGTPDQVPCMPFLTGHFIAWYDEMEEGDYWADPVLKLKAQVAVQERFLHAVFEICRGRSPSGPICMEISSIGPFGEWALHL